MFFLFFSGLIGEFEKFRASFHSGNTFLRFCGPLKIDVALGSNPPQPLVFSSVLGSNPGFHFFVSAFKTQFFLSVPNVPRMFFLFFSGLIGEFEKFRASFHIGNFFVRFCGPLKIEFAHHWFFPVFWVRIPDFNN